MIRLNLFPLLFSLFAAIHVQSQDHITLTGVVVDSETKELLAGASIHVSGTTLGTQSDQSGQFSLNIPNPGSSDSLLVTYVGYQKYAQPIVALKDKASLQINLISQATTLQEVIVRSNFWRKQYSPAQLKEDYTKFYTVMEKVHTGLFDYLTEREWQALKDSSLQLFTHPMSHSEFYRLIASHLENVFVAREETGGEYRSYVSGAMFGLKLPHSKIGVKVATWKSILAVEENPANRGRGVMPDYPVSITLEDFITGIDVTKAFVLELIAKNRKVR